MSEARWEGRRLCPDGGCIGVLDEAGRCPACGRIDPAAANARPTEEGDERDDREPPDVANGSDGPDGSDGRDGSEAEPRSAAAEPATGDEWQTRQLCEDGACIGVIEGGRCNTCGKAPRT